MANPERIAFMGSPDYAVTILEELNRCYTICGVITQPDQPTGRGKLIQSPPVKSFAESMGLAIFQPEKIRGDDFILLLNDLAPDAIVVAAYGKILPKSVLEFPKFGCINVHASLLPRWRGASPVYNAILHGDEKSGVMIMRMDEGVDTGAILASREITIDRQETTGSLTGKLSRLGADLLVQTLPEYFTGAINPAAQPEKGATYSRLIKKEDGRLDFSNSAEFLEKQVRACLPWPVAFSEWEGNPLRILGAEVLQTSQLERGQRGIIEKFPCVGTASLDLKLVEVQPAGKRPMRGCDFLNGARGWAE